MNEENLKSLELIELVYEMIEDGKKVPMTGKTMIDKKAILEILHETIQLYPDEFKKAQFIIRKKDSMMNEASERLNVARAQSAEFIENQVKNHDIVREAKERAVRIISEAEVEARQIRIYAREYADEILSNLEKEIAKTTETLLLHMKSDMEDFAGTLTKHMDGTSKVIKENVEELRAPLTNNK